MKAILTLLIVVMTSLPCLAADSKHLTAIVPKAGLSRSEYKSLEKFSTQLGKEIKANWFPANYPSSLRAVVKVHLDGTKSFELREHSINSDFDQTCLMAMERSQDLINYPSDKEIEFLFEYKHRNNVQIPTGSYLRWPAQVGMGYLSKKLGMNTFVQVPIY